jgi:hypothetical protein
VAVTLLFVNKITITPEGTNEPGGAAMTFDGLQAPVCKAVMRVAVGVCSPQGAAPILMSAFPVPKPLFGKSTCKVLVLKPLPEEKTMYSLSGSSPVPLQAFIKTANKSGQTEGHPAVLAVEPM